LSKKSPISENRRLSRDDWINGAIAFLSQHSVGTLRLDLLVKQMGVTKGSVYWHFASREDLLDAVLESWQTRMIRDVEAWLESAAGTPADRIRRLLRIGISARPDVPGGPLELSLRDWARRDARVAKIVMGVDAERLRIVRSLYLEMGLAADLAEAQALLHMTFVVGGRMMLFDGNRSTIERRLQIGERFLVPASADVKTALKRKMS
jgi:AcrR family transcriptional regulator